MVVPMKLAAATCLIDEVWPVCSPPTLSILHPRKADKPFAPPTKSPPKNFVSIISSPCSRYSCNSLGRFFINYKAHKERPPERLHSCTLSILPARAEPPSLRTFEYSPPLLLNAYRIAPL